MGATKGDVIPSGIDAMRTASPAAIAGDPVPPVPVPGVGRVSAPWILVVEAHLSSSWHSHVPGAHRHELLMLSRSILSQEPVVADQDVAVPASSRIAPEAGAKECFQWHITIPHHWAMGGEARDADPLRDGVTRHSYLVSDVSKIGRCSRASCRV